MRDDTWAGSVGWSHDITQWEVLERGHPLRLHICWEERSDVMWHHVTLHQRLASANSRGTLDYVTRLCPPFNLLSVFASQAFWQIHLQKCWGDSIKEDDEAIMVVTPPPHPHPDSSVLTGTSDVALKEKTGLWQDWYCWGEVGWIFLAEWLSWVFHCVFD